MDVVVGGVKKTVTQVWVIVGGVKKTVVSVSVTPLTSFARVEYPP